MINRADLSNSTSVYFERGYAKRLFTDLMTFLGWTVVFAVIYAQSPLYTSNQNQYFLHGLARAGFGYLKNDWLANTLDPTPLFSQLVRLTYLVFHTDQIFYLYYAILLGIYLFSLFGLGEFLFGISQPVPKLVYLTLLLVIHSAAIRFFLSRAFGPEWAYVLEGGLAGQRALGVVLQPSTFGVLLIFSIFLFVRGNTIFSLLPLALAVSLHPTYLLAAGLVTLAYIWDTYWADRNLTKSLALGLVALFLVSPVLIFVYKTFGTTPAETSARAQDILVNFRIPHHTVIAEWFDITSIVQLVILLVAPVTVRGMRLFPVLVIPLFGAAFLTLLQIATQSDALALLFPWRVSAILVPISVAVLTSFLVSKFSTRFRTLNNAMGNRIRTACLGLILLVALVGVTRIVLERQLINSSDEHEIMSYVKENKSPSDVYLVPIKMQDFRLATGAPIYVDFKSIPYQDAELLEWYRRIQLATDFYQRSEFDCKLIDKFKSDGVTDIVLSSEETRVPCSSLQLEYRNEHYRIFSISP